MSDIVERARRRAVVMQELADDADADGMQGEAMEWQADADTFSGLADEVERLRVELLRSGRLGNELASSIDHPTPRQQTAIEAWEER